MQYKTLASLMLLCALAKPALADITALVAIEPTARKDGVMLSRQSMEANLGKLLGQTVTVTTTDDLTDAMRSTRSGGYDVFIGPAQVAASAAGHGYELLGANEAEEQYVLVGKAGADSVNDLRKGRIYLPQQDSIYTYLARGLLTAHGLSFKDLNKVEYARYPQAGLVAIHLRYSDATVVHRDDWDVWNKENPGATKILAESGGVPGGFSVAVKKDMSADTRNQLSKWFATSARSCGMKPIILHPDQARYKRVAELGTFTPTSLPGVTVVAANDVKRLMNEGAVVVDTRNEKEFKQKHIPKAVFLPYHEKSLKDVAFDASLDDFKGLKSLNNKVPVVFHCNGPECWKSYKASRAALSAGFTKVYWYRGGMPDWEGTGQQIARE